MCRVAGFRVSGLLGGSWVVLSRVISLATIIVTFFRLLRTHI